MLKLRGEGRRLPLMNQSRALAALVVMSTCVACSDDEQPSQAEATKARAAEAAPPPPADATSVLPPIQKFVLEKAEFGVAEKPQQPAAWFGGQHQIVETKSGAVDFYVQGDDVVTAWRPAVGNTPKTKLWEKPGYKPPGAIDETQKAVAAGDGLPSYTVLETVKLLTGGKSGAILVKSFNAKTPNAQREALLRKAMAAEGLSEATLYCSEDAHKADQSESFAKSHPRARKCVLGLINSDSGGKLFIP